MTQSSLVRMTRVCASRFFVLFLVLVCSLVLVSTSISVVFSVTYLIDFNFLAHSDQVYAHVMQTLFMH